MDRGGENLSIDTTTLPGKVETTHNQENKGVRAAERGKKGRTI